MARSRDAGYVSAFEVGVANTEIKDESYKSHSVSRMRTRDRGYVSKTTVAGFIDESFEPIATTTVGSGGSSSITFSSIPATYKHLQIRMINRVVGNSASNINSNILIRLNGDTGSNYTRHLLYDQAGIGAAGTANNTSLFASAAPNSTNTTGIFGAEVVDILDYANTNKFKTTRALGGYDNNGVAGNRLTFESGVWRDTSAITTILIYPDNSETWAEYSQFALYGIKG